MNNYIFLTDEGLTFQPDNENGFIGIEDFYVRSEDFDPHRLGPVSVGLTETGRPTSPLWVKPLVPQQVKIVGLLDAQ